VTFVLSDDSAGKNSYLYNDPAAADGRWRFVTWDHNACIGQDWLTERFTVDWHEEYTYQNGLFARLLGEPSFAGPLRARYHERLAGAWSKANLDAMVEAYVVEIDASARRDWRKWEADYRGFDEWNTRRDFTDFDGEVAYVRGWLADRWDFVEATY
jgi:spore coat protein H